MVGTNYLCVFVRTKLDLGYIKQIKDAAVFCQAQLASISAFWTFMSLQRYFILFVLVYWRSLRYIILTLTMY